MNKIYTIFLLLLPVLGFSQVNYFPSINNWEEKQPNELGIDAKLISEAVDSIIAFEYTGPVDLRQAILKGFEREPYHKILGPTKKRGGPAGMVIKDGYIVAKWGILKELI